MGVPPSTNGSESEVLLDSCDRRRKIAAALSTASMTTTGSDDNPTNKHLSNQVTGQISVDLPRCHAYDLLIGSPLGQQRLRRILVASLLSNGDRFDYTQVGPLLLLLNVPPSWMDG